MIPMLPDARSSVEIADIAGDVLGHQNLLRGRQTIETNSATICDSASGRAARRPSAGTA